MLAAHTLPASAITTLFRFQIAILAVLMVLNSRKLTFHGAVLKTYVRVTINSEEAVEDMHENN